MNNSILEPEEHVLSTLERDGSRRWLKPKLSKGSLLNKRRLFAWLLIFVFTAIPFIKIGGTPFVLLDIPARRFTIATFTFLPTDTVLLAVFMVGLLLTIFLLTALFGRVWCGWACPQTVYMEFVFRPIERLFDGTTGRGGPRKKVAAWRTVAKYATYLIVCFYLANTFISYFICVDKLSQWVTQSPINHPQPFLIMAFVTGAMMFDFCFFREQTCLIACPYGRFQSVLLDQNSLIVAYDTDRGEPRGKKKKKGEGELPVIGDCVDCGNCVTTCPTGIDIRNGLQMECINCTQCIDACNDVMHKLGREPNLIRYSSQAHDQGKVSSLLRPRTIIYPMLLTAIVSLFLILFISKKTFDVDIFREKGSPYTTTDDGQIRNLMRLRIENRKPEPITLTGSFEKPGEIELSIVEDFILGPDEVKTFHVSAIFPRTVLDQRGECQAALKIVNQKDEGQTVWFTLLGPKNKPAKE
ncbi:MAG: cytochrome c oxidase accessory protein CcoG [Pirellulaceae bacterium]